MFKNKIQFSKKTILHNAVSRSTEVQQLTIITVEIWLYSDLDSVAAMSCPLNVSLRSTYWVRM